MTANNSCEEPIELVNNVISNFDTDTPERQDEICDSVRAAVERADQSGGRSFENIQGEDNFDKDTCESGELARLNDLYFDDLFVGKCTPTAGQLPTKINWLVVGGVVGGALLLIIMFYILKRMRA